MAFNAPLTYKGRPLVRKGNEIYYGSMSDPYVVYMQIVSTKNENGEEVSDKIHLVLMSTDETRLMKDRMIKQSVKNGLYTALDFADIMLERQGK